MCALLLSQSTDAVQDAFLCFIEWFCQIVIKKMQKIIPTSESVMLGYCVGTRQILWFYSCDAMNPNLWSSYNSSLHLISDTIIDCRRMQGLVMDLLCNTSDSLRHIPYCHGFWLFADVLTRYLLKGVENWWGLQICISGLECYGEPVWTRRRLLLLLWWWLV
jgi:hypothetical protein